MEEVVAGTLAVIGVSINGTALDLDAGPVGVVPGINVTFDGSASSGGHGVFLWDFADGSKATTQNATHAFAAGGLYNVTLTIGIGEASDVAWVLVNVTEPAPSVPQIVATIPFKFSGNVPLGNPNAPMNAGIDHRDHIVAVIDALEDGRPAFARAVRITLDGSGATAIDSFLYWRSPGGANLAQAGSFGAARIDHSLEYNADMAAGDYVVRVRLVNGANMDYTVTGEIDYYDF